MSSAIIVVEYFAVTYININKSQKIQQGDNP